MANSLASLNAQYSIVYILSLSADRAPFSGINGNLREELVKGFEIVLYSRFGHVFFFFFTYANPMTTQINIA